MKRYITCLLSTLFVLTAYAQKKAEFYAVYDGENTITAYYDGNAPADSYHFTDNNTFPLSNIEKIVFDPSIKNYRPTNCQNWFADCENLKEITGLEYLNTQDVTDMSGMFYRCISLTYIDLSHFNTAKATDMNEMFAHCWELQKIDLHSFNTSSVTNMSEMFSNCYKLENIDVSHFNTASVTKMDGMFTDCMALLSVDCSGFDTRNVINMSEMFSGCYNLKNIDLSSFHTEQVADMSGMFRGCRSVKTIDLGNFKTDHTTNLGNMFSSCIMLRTIYVGNNWNTAADQSTEPMFSFCRTICGGTGTRYNKAHADRSMATIDGGYFTRKGDQPYLPKAYAIVKDSVMTLYYGDSKPSGEDILFIGNYEDNTKKIKEIVFDRSFRNYKPESCANWFQGLTELQTITGMREYLNTENVADMSNMFKYCGFKTIDISGFNTWKTTDMTGMFSGCNKLETIFAGYAWKTSGVAKSEGMFAGCTKLYGAKGTGYNATQTDALLAHFDEGEGNPGYFTQKWQRPFVPEVKISEKDEPYVTIQDNVATFHYGRKQLDKHYYTITNFPHQYISKAVFDETFRFYCPKNCNQWFANCNNLTEIVDMEKYLDTDSVKSMSQMFRNCYQLTSINLSGFNTANVEKMDRMFEGCHSLQSVDLKKFNTQKVVDLEKMFAKCWSLRNIDLSSFDTRNVTNMGGLFDDCYNLEKLDLSGFKTANVTKTTAMFKCCYKLTTLDLSSFQTGKVENMGDMFCYCNGLKTIYIGSGWTTRSIPDKDPAPKQSETGGNGTTNMFTGCTALVGEKGTPYCYAYNGKDLAQIDGGKGAPGYFTTKGAPQWNKTAYAVLRNGVLTFYYKNNAPKGAYIIHGGKSTQEWSHAATTIRKVVFDISFRNYTPYNCYEWFAQCGILTEITGIKENFNTENVVNMAAMFSGCCRLTNIDLSGFKTGNVTTMRGMFAGCASLTSIDLSHLDTRNVTNTALMFDGCKNLQSINFEGFDTQNVRNMSNMFYGCKSLATVDVSGFNTSNCENMSYMFAESGIAQVDLSGFTTESIAHLTGNHGFGRLTGMFEGCANLKALDISSFKGATYSPGMFFGCSGLRKLKLFTPKNSEFGDYTDTGYDLSGLFAGCSSLRELDLSSFKKPDAPRSMKYMFANCTQLKTIYASADWDFQYVFTIDRDDANSIDDKTVEYQHNFTGLFQNCPRLIGGKGTKWTADNQSNEMYLTIDDGMANPGYFTKKQ